MIPFQSTIIPIYLVMREIALIDNAFSAILLNALFNAFGVFLLRQFIRGLPLELEVAIVDGANRWTIYWRIVLPLILNLLRGQYATDFSLVMAGSVIAVVPILIVFIIGQRQIIEGVAMTGV